MTGPVTQDDRNVMRRLVLALQPVGAGKRRTRWSLVADALGCGSTAAADLCARLEIDPDGMVDGPAPTCSECSDPMERDAWGGWWCRACEPETEDTGEGLTP